MRDTLFTSEQITAAQALLRREQTKLAEASRVSIATIKRIEAKPGVVAANEPTIEALRRALEAAGIEFTNGSEPRVKLKVAKPAISDEAAIGDDPESRGDPYIGSAK